MRRPENGTRRRCANTRPGWPPGRSAEDKDGTPEPRQPKLARYIVEGSTIEAISEVLRDDDEAQATRASQKSARRDTTKWPSSSPIWTATGQADGAAAIAAPICGSTMVAAIRIDRIGRGSFAIPNWSACFLGGIQPGPIQRIAKAADDDGLLQRFMYCGRRQATARAGPQARCRGVQRYEALFPKLSAMHPQKPPVDTRADAIVLHAAGPPAPGGYRRARPRDGGSAGYVAEAAGGARQMARPVRPALPDVPPDRCRRRPRDGVQPPPLWTWCRR